MKNARHFLTVCTTLALLVGASAFSPPAHAWLGLLGKLGSVGKGAAGAAGVAGKGAATGAGALAGVEAAEAANAATQAARAARAGGAAEGAVSAEQLAKASGIGKAVPDDIAAMLSTPGKTLLDVPDIGTRSWLSIPADKLGKADAPLMVSDYVKLIEGKPASGPAVANAVSRKTASPAPRLPTDKPVAAIPWHATELLLRAAHLGHKGAQGELDRICNSKATARPQACLERTKLQAKI